MCYLRGGAAYKSCLLPSGNRKKSKYLVFNEKTFYFAKLNSTKLFIMKGKQICKALKEIRLNIAQANDIKYTPVECNHKGSANCCVAKLLARLQWLQVLPLEQQALLLQWHRHIMLCQKLSRVNRN